MEYFKKEDLRKILDTSVEKYEIKFGKPNIKIETFKYAEGCASFINECRVYEHSKRIMFISNHRLFIIPFNKIIGYDVINLNQSSTPLITATTKVVKTDTGNMVKRAIIGGVVGGGVGAIIGAATAKKEVTEEMSKVDEYANMLRIQLNSTPNLELVINVDDISSPTLKVPFEDCKSKAEKMTAVLNVILKRNEENNENEKAEIVNAYPYLTKTRRKLGIEPIDPFKKQKEEFQQRMQEEREKAARKEKWDSIGGLIALAIIVALIIFALCVS